MEVLVPDLGDFSDVEVIEILVEVGDSVAVEDPLIVLETDKATMEVPSSHAGTIMELRVKRGDRVSTGDAIVALDAAETSVDESEPVSDAAPDGKTSTSADGTAPAQVAGPSTVVRDVTESVPDLGDFADVEIIEVLVAPGDSVERDAPLIVLETDKATMEVPATHPGKIKGLEVRVGDRVSRGDAIAVIETVEAEKVAEAASPQEAATEARSAAPSELPAGPARDERPAARAISARLVDERRFGLAHASPSVRKLARELGVDLGAVTGSGRKGRVTADDLKAFVKSVMRGQGPAAGRGLPEVPVVDFASFGEVESQALTRIQRISGPRLHASWVNIPHVTQHDEADVTELEEVRGELKQKAKEQGIHLTPLPFIIRAVIRALEEFAVFRSSLSADGESLIIKKYYHVGFAADTPNGLVVPVVRDADKLDLLGLARALGELSEKARAGKLSSKEIQGSVFSVSSLGGIGGTFFTPIINAPEVAILGVSRTQVRPVYEGERLVRRLMLPLSLSYDHRVIDGATAVRFTTRLTELLAQGRKLGEIGV